ncbi:MAG: transglycosylase SLT domain-containing protein [Aquabacterium sp.]
MDRFLPARPAETVALPAEIAELPASSGTSLLSRAELDRSPNADLWERIRAGFGMPDLEGPLVDKWVAFYAGKPDYMRRMTERGGRSLFHIVEVVSRRGMPMELALLPFIESAFNPQAMSTAKASGMWQFVPATGREYDLRQNVFRDDRRDVLASTQAALKYLQSLHVMFNDWQLALAAYNWGQGSVQRAQARNRKLGRPEGYLDLAMPDETRNYLPKLQAMKRLIARPEAHGLTLPVLENHPYFLSVDLGRDIDVELAARWADLSVDAFRELNPQLNKPVVLHKGTPQLLLPYDAANRFVRMQALHGDRPTATWTGWKVPRHMTPTEAAKAVGMAESTLREVNAIPARMLIKASSTLLVTRDGRRDIDVSVAMADEAALLLAPQRGEPKPMMVKAGQKGETVAAVARRYGFTPAQVAQWNRVSEDARFKPGQSVVVMTRPAAAKLAKASATRAAVPAKASRPAKPAAKVRVAMR